MKDRVQSLVRLISFVCFVQYTTTTCSKRYRTFKWRTILKPARLTMPIVALASVWTTERVLRPKSLSNVISPSACQAPFVRVYNLASAPDTATIACMQAQLLTQ